MACLIPRNIWIELIEFSRLLKKKTLWDIGGQVYLGKYRDRTCGYYQNTLFEVLKELLKIFLMEYISMRINVVL